MTERFNKSYNALLKAFFEGTLAKGTCAACAIGNIVADAMGIVVTKDFKCHVDNTYWNYLFFTTMDHKQILRSESSHYAHITHSKRELDSISTRLEILTGYTEQELAKIEYAFETNTKVDYNDYKTSSKQQILEDQFNGLSAVVDILCELDNISNLDKSYNKEFRKHPELIN